MTPALSKAAGLRIGWFSTGRGATSRRLLAAVRDETTTGRLAAQIAVVFCNRERGEDLNSDAFLDQVHSYHLPLVCLSSRDLRRHRNQPPVRKGDPLPEWRRQYDREVMRLLDPHPFDLGVLAGYMLIFCEEASARYNLLNLHPAAPGGPKGMWQDVIWHLIETRAQTAGVMMHLATPELDEGPPVTYCTYPIAGPTFDPLWQTVEGRTIEEIKAAEGEANPLFAEIRRHGVSREVPLVLETLRAFATGGVRIVSKQIVDSANHPISARDLTAEIENPVASKQA
jgi:folate-dependent phosphoribosylglycinamide formyltransferase PurN